MKIVASGFQAMGSSMHYIVLRQFWNGFQTVSQCQSCAAVQARGFSGLGEWLRCGPYAQQWPQFQHCGAWKADGCEKWSFHHWWCKVKVWHQAITTLPFMTLESTNWLAAVNMTPFAGRFQPCFQNGRLTRSASKCMGLSPTSLGCCWCGRPMIVLPSKLTDFQFSATGTTLHCFTDGTAADPCNPPRRVSCCMVRRGRCTRTIILGTSAGYTTDGATSGSICSTQRHALDRRFWRPGASLGRQSGSCWPRAWHFERFSIHRTLNTLISGLKLQTVWKPLLQTSKYTK